MGLWSNLAKIGGSGPPDRGSNPRSPSFLQNIYNIKNWSEPLFLDSELTYGFPVCVMLRYALLSFIEELRPELPPIY